MAKLRTTSPGQLGKYIAGILQEFDVSMKDKKLMQWNTSKVYIKDTKKNKEAIELFAKLAKRKIDEPEAYSVELETGPINKMCSIGSFEKPKVDAKGNRGDIAEGIFGAAITARFLHKNTDINKRQVKDVLSSLTGSGQIRDKTYKSPNKNKAVDDDVRFYLSLAKVNMDALLDPKQWDFLDDLFDSAVKYANGNTVVAWSKLLYENNQYNKIEVISDGLSNQKGTKVDVKLLVDDKKTDINVSLKAGDVKQFGQIGGSEFEKAVEMHALLFNINIKHLEDKYNQLLAKKDPQGALYLVYNYVKDQVNLKVRTKRSKDALLKQLGEGINHFATLGEENVTLVQLNSSEAKIYNFKGVVDAVSALDLSCSIKDSAGKPKLLLHDAKNRNLLEIRVKQENKDSGPYFRQYVEKGKLLGDLIAIYA
jgi:hypothetical protein